MGVSKWPYISLIIGPRVQNEKQPIGNSNSNSTFIALNLCQKTDSKAHHTKTLFNIQKPSWPANLFHVLNLTSDPCFKILIAPLLLVLGLPNVKTTKRKIMACVSFASVKFEP